MVELGYSLSSEEHAPNELVHLARRAEEAGFTYALISDHFHPWTKKQGQSPFVWSVIGGIAQVTQRLRLGTGVTCPILRMHPVIVAHAAATAGAMMPGRFFLGLGAGERLNEHVTGERWPPPMQRHDRLAEAIAMIRKLWEGGTTSYRGRFYTVEDACIYTLPDPRPPILVAAGGPAAAALAGRLGDGLMSTSPNRQLVDRFARTGGAGKPHYGQLTVCWAPTEDEGKRIAHEWWPTAGLQGPLGTELSLPEHFEQASAMVTPEQVAQQIVCGPDPQRHLERIEQYARAGFEYVYVHQVGPDQEGFFRFYEREILPRLR